MRQAKGEDVELGNTKLNGFQSRILQSSSVSKTIYENGLDVQSDDWQGASMTRVIRDSCVHFESEVTLPLNNDKGTNFKIMQPKMDYVTNIIYLDYLNKNLISVRRNFLTTLNA